MKQWLGIFVLISILWVGLTMCERKDSTDPSPSDANSPAHSSPADRNAIIISVADFGLKPNEGMNATPYVMKALEACRKAISAQSSAPTQDSSSASISSPSTPSPRIILTFPQGRYDFYPDDTVRATYHISAHDHVENRHVGIILSELHNIELDGGGSDFIFHKRMLPLALVDSSNVKLRNFSIDFEKPYYTQAEVVTASPEEAVVRFAPDTDYAVKDGLLYIRDEEGELPLQSMNEFDGRFKYLAWKSSDIGYKSAEDLGDGNVRIHGLTKKPAPTNILFMRNWGRPNPGIFSWRCKDMDFSDINIYWAQGMGTLSQRCENIAMHRVNVKPREGSGRVFTTVDALHFTACSGLITIEDGTYENMLDDAVNIHGDYLQILEISPDRKTLLVTYKHSQSFGYEAALAGETLRLTAAATMLPLGDTLAQSARPIDPYKTEITLKEPAPPELKVNDIVENITATPEIVYRNNTIRNNRARGALFSSPKRTLVEGNTFDHCSGSGILLSADGNQWFLSGPCLDLTIRKNTFIHCMTSHFQYCESVISIAPEIPSHGGPYYANISITDNTFILFEPSVLFAKSVKGLTFKNNTLLYDPKFGRLNPKNPQLFRLINCEDVTLEPNTIAPELQEGL